MKKFLEDFLNWLAIMGFTIILAPIWYFILTYGFNVDLANFSKKIGGMLIVFPPFIISGFLVSLFEEQEKENNTPKVEEQKVDEPKEDEPKEDEIITVTEIKGVKKIIKNGKVIYCEQLKADELKVFEQLK